MGAYNRTNGEPCCAHSYLMDEVLRGLWNFKGHYVSDCWAVKDFHEHHKVTSRPEESVKLALEKGCDVNCGCTYQRIMNAYNEGILPLEHIKRSAIRLFTTRYLLGMFEETEYDNITYDKVECKEHLAVASRATKESVVLLKNNGILPLNKEEIKTIGVIGPNADSRAALIGNYHGTSSRYVTVLEGIQDFVGDDVRVLYSTGCHLYKDREEPLAQPNDRLSEAKAVARNSDVVVLCLGLDETLEGEEGDAGNAYASGDKKDLQLPESQRTLLQTIIEMQVPFVLCVMAGSAMDLNVADEHAAAILQVWYPGARGGKDVAEILFGQTSPSGKLPITLYRDLEGMPEFTDYQMKGRTYRFVERMPLYPFGYGLTYGNTRVKAMQVEETSYSALCEHGATVILDVVNDGNVATEDVVQVYTHVQGTENEVRNPKLVAFKRVLLRAGEEKRVTITVANTAFSTVNVDGERCYDGTGVVLYAGFGQPDERTEELTGKKAVSLEIK